MKRLGELAELLGLELVGDADHRVDRIASLRDAEASALAFVADARYRKYLPETLAGAVIVSPADREQVRGNGLIAEHPHLAFARAAQLLYPPPAPAGIASSAQIAADATLGAAVTVGANSVIESGASLGDGVWIGPGVVIGRDTIVGNECQIGAGCAILADVHLGARCRVQAGAVIGSDGFGFARDGVRWERVPQVGGVRIGDDVDIGAGTTIDRGAIGNTVLCHGVRIDNQVQIAHNVEIGEHTAMAACVGISGSTRIGRECTIAGMVGIAGHLVIGDKVHITGMTQVTKSLAGPGVYSSGTGVDTNRNWRRNAARFHQLDDIARRLRTVERRLADGDNGSEPAENDNN
ncbi:MAG: UDP-3-O-(3-hydroxymyristoyl)glucosamine N-acyltransferase [Ectothiorhodospiraceae bacterium]